MLLGKNEAQDSKNWLESETIQMLFENLEAWPYAYLIRPDDPFPNLGQFTTNPLIYHYPQ